MISVLNFSFSAIRHLILLYRLLKVKAILFSFKEERKKRKRKKGRKDGWEEGRKD